MLNCNRIISYKRNENMENIKNWAVRYEQLIAGKVLIEGRQSEISLSEISEEWQDSIRYFF